MKRIAIVLWSGEYGGAETWSLALAKGLSRRGCRVGVVLVSDPGPLCERLADSEIPYECLGHRRGRAVLTDMARFSSTVSQMGGDAAILPSGGYLSAALRLGGYHGAILAVEHGTILQLSRMGRIERLVRVLDALSGAWAVNAHVVPSDYILREMKRRSYGGSARRIYLGTEFSPSSPDATKRDSAFPSGGLVVGFAGRLIRGKGLDVLLDALSRTQPRSMICLQVAGDGPERMALEARVRELAIVERVRFHGWISNLGEFWPTCDVAVVPSCEWIESFGMVAVEAMAAGLPVIATRNGGLAEVVRDGETGALFEPGDADALARLLEEYAHHPELRMRQGPLARARARSHFDIDRCAGEFLELVQQVTGPESNPTALAGGA